MNILLPAVSILLAGAQPAVPNEVSVDPVRIVDVQQTAQPAGADPSLPVPDATVAAPQVAAPGDAGQADPQTTVDPDEIVVTGRGEAPPEDPLQSVNIQSYRVVQSVDRAVVGPIARGYRGIVPEPVRDGLGNALRNLSEPVNFLNYLLQFKFGKAAETLGRFAINSTVGVAGLFDVAKRHPVNLPYRDNGFANTLGFYGVKPGAYFYLPLVGPTTVRDMFGNTVDLFVLPVAVGSPFNRPEYAIPTTTIDQLNQRVARDGEITRLREESDDPYVETRTLYLEMRQREIDALRGRLAPVVIDTGSVPDVLAADEGDNVPSPPAPDDAPDQANPPSPPGMTTATPPGL